MKDYFFKSLLILKPIAKVLPTWAQSDPQRTKPVLSYQSHIWWWILTGERGRGYWRVYRGRLLCLRGFNSWSWRKKNPFSNCRITISVCPSKLLAQVLQGSLWEREEESLCSQGENDRSPPLFVFVLFCFFFFFFFFLIFLTGNKRWGGN